MKRVLLIDCHPVVRKGLRAILAEAMPNLEFGEASTGREGIEQLRQGHWDLVILQIALPDIQWLDLLRRVRSCCAALPILVFCRYPEDQYGPRCIKAGASGYLCKTSSPEAVVEAVRHILHTGIYISPYVAEHLAREAHHEKPLELHESLSNREYEIFRMLTSGMTPTEIGHELCLSVKTISTYRQRILAKMGMKSTADMTQYAASIGLMY